ncbi:MAG: iron-containing redox enzyme family protein [Egibacteraceae bacterium]
MAQLPQPRGPVTAALLHALRLPAGSLDLPAALAPADPLADDDLHLALYCCYELHYRGFDEVDERWEWHPSLLAFRATLESAFEAALRDVVGGGGEQVDTALQEIASADDGPSLSRHLERHGTLDQLVEFVIHRSAYQLKEADPHSWAIPRLSGLAKAALVEIQIDEYGGGRPDRMHARLFADTMEALGLDSAYGAFLDHIPGVTLAGVNLMSLCGLHRRLRGAICGHLALFEMTSSIPNRRYASALRRLGFREPRATTFFDEHVEADAVHEQIAAVDLVGGLVRAEPQLADDVLWGARALAELDRRFQAHTLGAWQGGRTSLRSWPRSGGPLIPASGPEAGDLVGAVTERSDA